MQGFTAPGSDVPVLLLMDTAGCGCDEQTEEDSDSKRNDGEAQVCSIIAPRCQQCRILCTSMRSLSGSGAHGSWHACNLCNIKMLSAKCKVGVQRLLYTQ